MKLEKIDIVVADDHNLFRKGMVALLEDFDFVGEIREAGNGKELLDLLTRLDHLPDLILLDLNMPEMDGLEATCFIRRKDLDIRILVLSMDDDAQLVGQMVNAGVNGYLLKNADPEELELAIKKVMKNDFFFSGALAEAVFRAMGQNNRVMPGKICSTELTEREIEVLRLICEECTAAEIADKLALSPRTVEGVRSKLLEKTGSRNIAGLVVFAAKNKLFRI